MASMIGEFFDITVETAIRKLAESADMVGIFRKEFRSLNKKLKYVRDFVKDADQQSRHKDDVKEWLEKIRVFSLLAEDICEEYAVESMYRNKTPSCGLVNDKRSFRWRMGRKIKRIKHRMRSIIKDGNELNLLNEALPPTSQSADWKRSSLLPPSGSDSHPVLEEANELKLFHQVLPAQEASASTSQSADWKRSNLLPTDSHPVGIQSSARRLTPRSNLLPSDSHPVGIESKVEDMCRMLEDPAFSVIAVVGMGGMGKTYLLQHAYINLRYRYEISIWLSVSQSYSISNLQKNAIFQIDRDLSEQIKNSEVNEEVLAPMIHEKLQCKRCLVVLDDVWRASREDDLLVRLGLPTGGMCKIVVTTRIKEVCTNLNAGIYEMQYLSDEESWRLFNVYAFGERSQPPQHSESVVRGIVGRCGNLPLAIKTIGTSLAQKPKRSEWESKLHQLEGVGAADIDRIISVLRPSYDSLSAHLKTCFAYLSFFPEDEKIDCEYLIYLWIGEGLIPAGKDQWKAAWDCLRQLDNLCLIQLWEESEDGCLTKYCRIHDLMLDLAVKVSRENKCIFSIEEASKDASPCWCRILLGKKYINDDDISEIRPICFRTFSLSHNKKITSIPPNLLIAMRGLRVLDLSWTGISELPESIGKMKLLKVLNLKDTYIEEVSECVRHLKSLLFLALPDRCKKLPVWIHELKCLQHLQCQGACRMPKEISKLRALKTLRSDYLDLSAEEEEFLRPEDFANMSQIEELWLNINHDMELEGIRPWQENMRRLTIRNSKTQLTLELSEEILTMRDLEKLQLYRFAVPTWICGLANLKDLELNCCDCTDYPELQRMPNLVRLTVWGNEKCTALPKAFGNAGGFPQLRFLNISDLPKLEEFPKLEGAMECLEEFRLRNCPQVKKMGKGLQYLRRLKLFDYLNSGTQEFKETFEEGGEYWSLMKAINPHVDIKGIV